MSAWDDLTPAQRGRVLWKVGDAVATLGVAGPEDVARYTIDAFVEVADHQVGRHTSPAFLEKLKQEAFDQGHDDGRQAGWDEAVAALEQLAGVKA